MCNKCLRSGGGVLLGEVLETFLSTLGSKLGVSERSVGRILVSLERGDTDVTALGQQYLMRDGKKSVEGLE